MRYQDRPHQKTEKCSSFVLSLRWAPLSVDFFLYQNFWYPNTAERISMRGTYESFCWLLFMYPVSPCRRWYSSWDCTCPCSPSSRKTGNGHDRSRWKSRKTSCLLSGSSSLCSPTVCAGSPSLSSKSWRLQKFLYQVCILSSHRKGTYSENKGLTIRKSAILEMFTQSVNSIRWSYAFSWKRDVFSRATFAYLYSEEALRYY